MKTQLIKIQDKFILVSDEKQKKGDSIIHKSLLDKIQQAPDEHSSTQEHWYKVISENPDFSLLSEEDCKTIRYVDIEKLAHNYLYSEEDTTIVDKNHPQFEIYRGFINGFKTAQFLNDKMFGLEDMINAYREGTNLGALYESLCDYDSHDCEEADQFSKSEYNKFIQSLQQKSWDVEVEMKIIVTQNKPILQHQGSIPIVVPHELRPKITDGKIKITKIL